MAGLRPLFNLAGVREFMDQKIQAAEAKTLEALQYQGEEFVNKARELTTYADKTGNLRSSVGYIILKDGDVIDRNFKLSEKGTDRKSGMKKAKDFVKEITSEYPKGYVLIGVAGMNYAAAVESKGYDVITGSAPNDNDIRDLFGAIKL